MRKDRIHYITLALILIVAALLRFHNYAQWSLSNDELSALNRLQYDDFKTVMKEGVMLNDMHPPGVQAFLFCWTKIAGYDPAAVRFPFVVAGILSVIIFYWLAKLWLNKSGALAATAAMAALIFPVLYSQLARPYSPGLLFSLTAGLAWTKYIFHPEATERRRKDLLWLAVFVIACSLCMYIHYFAMLFAGLLVIAGMPFLRKGRLIYWMAGAIMMLIFFLPALPVFLYQMKAGGLGTWLGPPGNSAFFNYIYYSFNESFLLVALIIIILVTSTALYGIRRNRLRWMALMFFMVPFAIAYFYSIYKNPVYQHSIMLFSFPYLLLFAFSFMPDPGDARSAAFAFLVLAAATVSTVFEKRFYKTQYFGVFKELVEHANQTSSELGDSKVLFIANVIRPYYINYYHELSGKSVNYALYDVSADTGLAKLNVMAAASSADYLSYSWSNILKPAETEYLITRYFPYRVKSVDYFNSGYRLFSKIPGTGTPAKVLFDVKDSFESLHGSPMAENEIHFSGGLSVKYTPENEFGPTIKYTVKELQASGNVIHAMVYLFASAKPAEACLVIQMDHEGKTIQWLNAAFSEFYIENSKWQPVFLSIQADDLPPDAVVSFYVWNPARETFYIDDLQIKVFGSDDTQQAARK